MISSARLSSALRDLFVIVFPRAVAIVFLEHRICTDTSTNNDDHWCFQRYGDARAKPREIVVARDNDSNDTH